MINNKLVFVCSPYAGNIAHNIARAKELCLQVLNEGNIPIAPHLHYPLFLDEDTPEGRKAGLRCGLKVLESCDEMLIDNTKKISKGMALELVHAQVMGKKIRFLK